MTDPAEKIEKWAIEKLIPYARNARTHSDEQVGQIAASIREWGWTTPVLVDEDGGIIAGHGRTMAAKRLGMREVPVMVARGWSDAKKRAYVLADNKLALNAGWDDSMLALELKELGETGFDLDLTGFSLDEINALTPLEVEPGLTDEDAVPEAPEEPTTRLGDVWILGQHRLMCGDSTSIDAVEKLVGDKDVDFVFTSPPYNAGDSEKLSGNTHTTDNKYATYQDNKPQSEYLNFLCSFTNAWKWKAKCLAVNIQQLAGNKIAFIEWLHHYKDSLIDVAIWDKGHAAPQMAKNVMNSCFEYIVFLSQTENPTKAIPCSNFHGNVKNVYSGSGNKKNEFSSVHAATFPVDFPEWAIQSFTKANAIVGDAFGGTGTTLIACEKTARQCRMMELDPKYCDVIIKRWEEYTGKNAVNSICGRKFKTLQKQVHE
jgi:DNA modification methylase